MTTLVHREDDDNDQNQQTSQPLILSNHKPSNPAVSLLHKDSSIKQINLTVDSINRLAEIISHENLAVQQSMNNSNNLTGYDQNNQQSNAQYTPNQNMGDHSVLLKSPVAPNSHHQPQFVLEVSQVDSSFRGTASNNNNPMLTLSGHDIQALNATPIGQLP